MKTYKICIIGGGIVGSSIAYHLAKFGEKNVAVFEKNYISSGATGRCGGGIRQQWSARMNVRLAMRSVKLFERFKEDTGFDIEYKQGGYLLMAYSDDEAARFEKNVKMQKEEGLEVEILSPKMVKERYPYINTEGIVLATFGPTDGHANPHLANFGYIFAAKRMGVDVYTHTEVEDIDVVNKKVVGIKTTAGYFKCETVVNAAGGWSKEVGKMVGIEFPTTSYRHQVFVTEPLEDFFPFMAISFDGNFYMRQTKHGQFIMGMGDPNEKPGVNRDVSFHFEKEMAKKMVKIFPFLENTRIIRHWAGCYNMSPDAQPIIGCSKDVDGFCYAIGFSGHGFMLAPAVGEAIAQKILFGRSEEVEIDYLDMDRFKGKKFEVEGNVV